MISPSKCFITGGDKPICKHMIFPSGNNKLKNILQLSLIQVGFYINI